MITSIKTIITVSVVAGCGIFLYLSRDGNVASTEGSQPGRQHGTDKDCASPKEFGAVGDGVADDTQALQKWLALSSGSSPQRSPCLFLPTGIYRATDNLVMRMPEHSHGPRISGACGGNSRVSFDKGYGFTLTSSTALFYGDFRCISFSGNSDRVLVDFSSSTTDALNGFNIDNVVVNNNSDKKGSVAVRFGGLYTSRIFVTANCNGKGSGVGIKIAAGSMNTIKVSAGNCHTGLNLTGDRDAVSGNLFDAVDLEVNKVQLLIDGEAVRSNIFIGGVLSFMDPDSVGINATAGYGNILKSMAYGGSGRLIEGRSGVIWENTQQDLTSTPDIPASGEALPNSFVQPLTVNMFGGQVSSVEINGEEVCDRVPCMAILMPGDNIAMKYSEKPVWRWRALRF